MARRLHDEFPLLRGALADGQLLWAHVDLFCHQANPRVTNFLTFRCSWTAPTTPNPTPPAPEAARNSW